jgi:hypothetical protein
MKLAGAFLVASLVAVPSARAQSLLKLPSDGATVGDLVKKLPQLSADTVRRKIIGLDTSGYVFVFAAAGSVAGAGGTYFRSDVTLINHRGSAQRIAVGFLAQGVDNSNVLVDNFEIPANTPVILSDFIADTLGKTGLGTVLITAQTSGGALDTAAQLDGFSRIWSPQPGAAGSVSQGFPSVAFQDSLGSLTAYALGLRHDSQFRTNVGIVNFDSVAHTWTVEVNGLGGRTSFTVAVPPVSMRQVPVPAGNWGDLILALEADGSGFNWSGYGAAVDNVSGDSWSAHASQP